MIEEETPFIGESPKDQEPQPSLSWRLLVGAISLIAITGMLWTYQVRPYFLYRETPATIVAPLPPPSVGTVSELTLRVPIRIIVARGDDDAASSRSLPNVAQLTDNAEAIWHQASVAFDVRSIEEYPFSDTEQEQMFSAPEVFWEKLRPPGDNSVLVVLTGSLRGSNGIAWPPMRGFAVADTTTVPDFRAYAHELGHVLGLTHTDDGRDRLLYRGANGTLLTTEEIERARANAERFF